MGSVTEAQREWAKIYMSEQLTAYRRFGLACVICPGRRRELDAICDALESEFERPVSVIESLAYASRNLKSYIEVSTSNPFINRKVRLYEVRDKLGAFGQSVDRIVCDELLGW